MQCMSTQPYVFVYINKLIFSSGGVEGSGGEGDGRGGRGGGEGFYTAIPVWAYLEVSTESNRTSRVTCNP